MSLTAQQLYDLLPSVYRLRDSALEGDRLGPDGQPVKGPLQALLAVVSEQLDALSDDVDQLYDDQFIETCAEWVVPYIGELIGARGVYTLTSQTVTQRAQVANTIHYRRRKGTVEMLEELARDVTGWPARAVEFFQVLATTQYVNHLRPGNLSFASLRDASALELIGTPFDQTAHMADVRHIANGRGKYNLPNIGLFLWRLQPFDVSGGEPFEVTTAGPGLYTFNPLGQDQPLYNPAQEEREFTHLANEIDVPGPLRRRPLYDELEARRAALAAGKLPDSEYFGAAPAFEVLVQQADGSFKAMDPQNIFICDLSGWPKPHSDGQLLADPVLGRLAFKTRPAAVRVNYTYAFSTPMGGGPYDRLVRVSEWLPPSEPKVTFQVGVTQLKPVRDSAPGDPLVATLGEGVKAWHDYLASTKDAAPFGMIVVMDSATYPENITIDVPQGTRLAIVAGDWPPRKVKSGGLTKDKRLPGDLTPENVRPVLAGSVAVTGTPPPSGSSGGPAHEFILDGLLVTAGFTVKDGDLGRLRVSDCTLAPGGGDLKVESGPGAGVHNRFLTVHVESSILGPVDLGLLVPTLELSNSIVSSGADGDAGKPAILAEGADATICNATVFGTTHVRSLIAESLFTGIVTAQRGQAGCVRYCYLPPGSRTPRPYRCQPERAAQAAVDAALKVNPNLSMADQNAIVARVEAAVQPQFSSTHYGDPDYAQLRLSCPVEIRSGAEDESEIGAFHDLFQPQRETNLRVRLDEYLRMGLEAGFFYVS